MVEADIVTLLQPLVGGRVFPDIAPEGTAVPYATYQQIGGAVLNYTSDETPDLKNGNFQINVWAATRAEASTIALQIEDALRTASVFQARPEAAPISQYEPDTKLYGTIQDFSIWSAR